MDQVRTAVQKQADEELEQAILKCMQAYGMLEEAEVIADFAVLCASNKIHPDGVVQTNYPTLLPNGDIPWYRLLGLLEMHKTLAVKMISRDSDNG